MTALADRNIDFTLTGREAAALVNAVQGRWMCATETDKLHASRAAAKLSQQLLIVEARQSEMAVSHG